MGSCREGLEHREEGRRMPALNTKDISLDQAQKAVAAAMKKAESIGTKMDIAVVDAASLSVKNRVFRRVASWGPTVRATARRTW
jgi:hypothetical protein